MLHLNIYIINIKLFKKVNNYRNEIYLKVKHVSFFKIQININNTELEL